MTMITLRYEDNDDAIIGEATMMKTTMRMHLSKSFCFFFQNSLTLSQTCEFAPSSLSQSESTLNLPKNEFIHELTCQAELDS